MSKDITIPLRTCSGCGESDICRDQDDGQRLCGICELVVLASTAAVYEADEVQAMVMPLVERGEDASRTCSPACNASPRRGVPVADPCPRQKLLGIDWMTERGMHQALPRAYTEHIGRQLLAHITERKAA
jgi:hypothetical protein